MLTVNIIILILFLICFLLSLRKSKDLIMSLNKKEHSLFFLYPLAMIILTKTELLKKLKRKEDITDKIKALYITTKPELIQKLYWCSRISTVIAIIILFNLLSLMGLLMKDNNSILVNGKYLMRPGYGEGNSEVKLNVILEEENKAADEKRRAVKSKEVTIDVKERSYNQRELQSIFSQAFEYVKNAVLGMNQSTDFVTEKLNFISAIPGTGITVEWEPEDYNLIRLDGTINSQEVGEDGRPTKVKVILEYQEQESEFSMSFTIMPKQPSDEEILSNQLQSQIDHYSEKTSQEKYLELPEKVEKFHLNWMEKEESNEATLLLLGVIAAILAWFAADKELDKKLKKRKEQMLLDYPEIINKFTLLINAGMTINKAWNKIAEDYACKITKNHKKKRYAYEEMLITCNELKLGLPESIAYEQYGRRTGLVPYIKFGVLVSQNLKKGNRGFSDLLMKEAIDAFEDRKEIAKRLGEEAGTKLLIPMMGMLIIIFLIIMLPAFWAFRF